MECPANRRLTTASVLLVTAICAVRGQAQTPSPQPVTYETFCRLDTDEQRRLFNDMTPANRAAVVREQVDRWRHGNRERLTPAQRETLDELLSLLTPEMYGGGARTPEHEARLRSVRDRQQTLFSPDERSQMQPNGGCLPPVKAW